MKLIIILAIFLLPPLSGGLGWRAFAQNVTIPDANFKAYLVSIASINTNADLEIQTSEAAAYTGVIFVDRLNIANLTGIEAFTALTVLSCSDNQLTSLNVSTNTALTDLDCSSNSKASFNTDETTAGSPGRL